MGEAEIGCNVSIYVLPMEHFNQIKDHSRNTVSY